MRTQHSRGFFAALLVTLCLAAVVVLATAQRATREQHVVATVLGADGAPVTGLGVRDFVVREDDIAREIVRVDPAVPPSHVVLLIDTSAAIEDLVTDLRAAVGGFTRTMAGLPSPPSLGLTTTGERPTVVVAPTPRSAGVEQAAARLTHRPNSGAYLLDGIVETTGRLRGLEGARPVIVAFVAEDGPEFSTIAHQQVEDALRRAHVTLWTIVLQDRGVAEVGPEARERSIVTGDVAKASGGSITTVLSKEGLAKAFEDLASALASSYDVTYGRPDTLIPPSAISVAVNTPRARVMARKWTD